MGANLYNERMKPLLLFPPRELNGARPDNGLTSRFTHDRPNAAAFGSRRSELFDCATPPRELAATSRVSAENVKFPSNAPMPFSGGRALTRARDLPDQQAPAL